MELILNIFIYLNFFIMGTLFGSFFSLATYRIPRKIDIVFKNSYCPNCNHNLNFFDLIPILSYILNKGKCRYCKQDISIRYLLFEVFNGILFMIIYAINGINLNLIIFILLYSVLFVVIGSNIMNKKYLNNKKGVFIVELAIAFILFTIFLTAAYINSNNYSEKSRINILKNNSMIVAMKNMELALGFDYDNLNSFENEEVMDNVRYVSSVTVQSYKDVYNVVDDKIKIINCKVSYMVLGKEYNYSIDTIKKKVI
jgi:hypothetical protein